MSKAYMLVSRASVAAHLRARGPRAPWHVLRAGPLGPDRYMPALYPSTMAMCGVVTSGVLYAQVVEVGTAPDGSLCPGCRRLSVKGGAYVAQGPRPAASTCRIGAGCGSAATHRVIFESLPGVDAWMSACELHSSPTLYAGAVRTERLS